MQGVQIFKRSKRHLKVESKTIDNEINRSKRFGFNFGVLAVEVPQTVSRGLSSILPGRTISFHVMQKHIRRYDTIVQSLHRRYYVILPQTDKTGVGVVSEKIKKLSSDYGWGNISIGSAVYPQDGTTAEKLLEKSASQII